MGCWSITQMSIKILNTHANGTTHTHTRTGHGQKPRSRACARPQRMQPVRIVRMRACVHCTECIRNQMFSFSINNVALRDPGLVAGFLTLPSFRNRLRVANRQHTCALQFLWYLEPEHAQKCTRFPNAKKYYKCVGFDHLNGDL